jgi:hypothetical protein
MKRMLLSGLLLVAVTFAPCLHRFVDIQLPTSQIVCALASPVFWQLWNEFLTRELAEWTSSASNDAKLSPWPSLHESDTLFCLLVQALLKRAFDPSLSPVQHTDASSNSTSLDTLCRTMGSDFSPIPEFPVPQQHFN